MFIEAHIEVQEVQKNESKLCDKIGIPSAIINPNYLMKEAGIKYNVLELQ